MMIKTSDGEKNVASKGLGGAALGLAIPGTVALVNQLAGGAWGLGRAVNVAESNCGHNHVTHDTRVIGALESELARVNSERYADMIGINTYKEAIALSNKNDDKINANYKELAQFITALDKQIAVERANTECNFRFLDNKIDSRARELYEYVNDHFVPGKLIMPKSSICPEPLSACTPVTFPAQVVTTASAPTTGEVALNAMKASK